MGYHLWCRAHKSRSSQSTWNLNSEDFISKSVWPISRNFCLLWCPTSIETSAQSHSWFWDWCRWKGLNYLLGWLSKHFEPQLRRIKNSPKIVWPSHQLCGQSATENKAGCSVTVAHFSGNNQMPSTWQNDSEQFCWPD